MEILNLCIPIALKITAAIEWSKLGSGTVTFVLVVIGSFLLLLLLVSILRFHNIISLVHSKEDMEKLDPKDAFYLCVVRRISNLKFNSKPFCLVLVSPKAQSGETATDPVEIEREEILKKVRPNLRANDECSLYEKVKIAILVEVGPENIRAVADRLDETFGKMTLAEDTDETHKPDLRMGCAFFPDTAKSVEDLFSSAETALAEAKNETSAKRWQFATPLPEPTAAEKEEEDESRLPSYIDPVTGLLKARKTPATAQKYISQYTREDKAVFLLLLKIQDIDRYCKDYGEEVLDALRSGLSGILQANLREDDLISCWGDHGFLVGISADSQAAKNAAKRLLEKIQKTKTEYANYRLRLKVAIGIAGYPDHKRLPRDIIYAAELALESAARKGRNVFECFTPKLEQHKRKQEERKKEVF